MAYELILTETRGRVGYITLNRPEALNALNGAMSREIIEASKAYDADPEIGAIVITGSAKAFAAGADIKEMAERGYADMYLNGPFEGWTEFSNLRTPIIAAVAGFALGGGCELAMMCDVILAADTAKFGQPEIKLGVIPGMGGTQRLTRAVGKYKAAELILTGRMMGAEEAERAGLASRVVPADELLDEAAKTAEIVASMSLPVAYAAKDAIQAAEETSLREGLRFERQAFAALFALEDQTEGMGAFVEKRTPDFKHR